MLSFQGSASTPLFPGRTRPGLIEAGADTAEPRSNRETVFPGRTRPGLIEACQRIDLQHHFRGGPAPASLKRRYPRIGFPGRTRPGLIEAWPISGADPPRPH